MNNEPRLACGYAFCKENCPSRDITKCAMIVEEDPTIYN